MARHPTYNEDTAKKVREKALLDIEQVLLESAVSKRFGAYKKAMLLKLATTVLPRVTEISGKDGGEIKLQITGMKIIKE